MILMMVIIMMIIDLDAIDPTIYPSYLSDYPSITVIHLSLSLLYSHSYDVIPYRDAINLSIHMCIYHIYPSNIYEYLSYLSFMSIYHIYHIPTIHIYLPVVRSVTAAKSEGYSIQGFYHTSTW